MGIETRMKFTGDGVLGEGHVLKVFCVNYQIKVHNISQVSNDQTNGKLPKKIKLMISR